MVGKGSLLVYDIRPLNSSEQKMSLAEELLLKVKSGRIRGSIKLKDVEEILYNDDFTAGTGLLTATPDGVLNC